MKTRSMSCPSSSTEKLVPIQDLYRDNDRQDHDLSPSNCRQLCVLPPAVASATSSSRFSRFNLPDGWITEEVRRRHNYHHIDKYYYEEETGLKFRSLLEVKRYLNGEEHTPRRTPRARPREQVLRSYVERHGYSKHVIYSGKVITLDGEDFNNQQLAIVKSTADAGMSTTNLPSGWIIERVPRRFGGSDKYYYEPRTGQRFRSLAAVFRHLQGLEEDMPLSAYIEEIKENVSLSKAFKLHRKGKNRASRKRDFATSNHQISSIVSLPKIKKIKWVLGSTRGDVWYPFNCEVPVSESVKQEWNQRFMAVMKDGDNAAQKSVDDDLQACDDPRQKQLALCMDPEMILVQNHYLAHNLMISDV